MSIQNIKDHIDSLNGKFFTVKFIKKNGDERVMTARTGVKKYLHGGVSRNSNPNHVIVFDVNARGYRTVDLENVFELHSQGYKFTF